MRVNVECRGLVNDDDALVLVEDIDHTDDLSGNNLGLFNANTLYWHDKNSMLTSRSTVC